MRGAWCVSETVADAIDGGLAEIGVVARAGCCGCTGDEVATAVEEIWGGAVFG
jgi:hypothetical protein